MHVVQSFCGHPRLVGAAQDLGPRFYATHLADWQPVSVQEGSYVSC